VKSDQLQDFFDGFAILMGLPGDMCHEPGSSTFRIKTRSKNTGRRFEKISKTPPG
jgi:hypothetical protein